MSYVAKGTRGWSSGLGAGAPSDVLSQPMWEHRTTGTPHEKIPPLTHTRARTEEALHALPYSCPAEGLVPRLAGQEQRRCHSSRSQWQGTACKPARHDKNQPYLHPQLTGKPGATPRLCYGAGAPGTCSTAPQCSMHKVHPGKVLSILTPASQQDPAAWHLPLAMGGRGWPRPAEPPDRLFS